jgi:hypothetical protein
MKSEWRRTIGWIGNITRNRVGGSGEIDNKIIKGIQETYISGV